MTAGPKIGYGVKPENIDSGNLYFKLEGDPDNVRFLIKGDDHPNKSQIWQALAIGASIRNLKVKLTADNVYPGGNDYRVTEFELA